MSHRLITFLNKSNMLIVPFIFCSNMIHLAGLFTNKITIIRQKKLTSNLIKYIRDTKPGNSIKVTLKCLLQIHNR